MHSCSNRFVVKLSKPKISNTDRVLVCLTVLVVLELVFMLFLALLVLVVVVVVFVAKLMTSTSHVNTRQ